MRDPACPIERASHRSIDRDQRCCTIVRVYRESGECLLRSRGETYRDRNVVHDNGAVGATKVHWRQAPIPYSSTHHNHTTTTTATAALLRRNVNANGKDSASERATVVVVVVVDVGRIFSWPAVSQISNLMVLPSARFMLCVKNTAATMDCKWRVSSTPHTHTHTHRYVHTYRRWCSRGSL